MKSVSNVNPSSSTITMKTLCNLIVQFATVLPYIKRNTLLLAPKQNPSPDTVYFSADMEKVIMLPRLEMFLRVIFCNRIVAFNETFVPIGQQSDVRRPLPCAWHEGIPGNHDANCFWFVESECKLVSSVFATCLVEEIDRLLSQRNQNVIIYTDGFRSQNNQERFHFRIGQN